MPIFALAIIALQIACGVHVVRTGQNLVWLFVIIFVPLIGCAIYVLAVVLPEMQSSPGARRAARGMVKVIDPDRDYRARVRDAEMVGSADSKRLLAEEHLQRGNPQEAIALFESAATGILADDPTLLFGLARARFAADDPAGTLEALDRLREANPQWQSSEAHMIYARALEALGRLDEACAEFEALARYFAGEEARTRLALLYKKLGRNDEARELFQTVLKNVANGTAFYRRQQREWQRIAQDNL